MKWKPIPHVEWPIRAENDFWHPYGRKRGFQTKNRMIKDQYSELLKGDSAQAHAFALQLASDQGELSSIRAKAYVWLAQLAEDSGNRDQAVDFALSACAMGQYDQADYQTYFACEAAVKFLIHLVIDGKWHARAAEIAEVVRKTPPTISSINQRIPKQLDKICRKAMEKRANRLLKGYYFDTKENAMPDVVLPEQADLIFLRRAWQ